MANRREFIEEVNDFDDLLRFCYDQDCYICEDIRDGESWDEYVWDGVRDWCDSWESLRDWLDDLPSVGRWDYVNAYDNQVLDDDDFARYKNDVLDWMDENDYWDDDDDDDDESGGGAPYDSAVYLFSGPAPKEESPLVADVCELFAG